MESKDLTSELSTVGLTLKRLIGDKDLCTENKQRLQVAAGMVQKVFVEVANGRNATQAALEAAQNEGAVLLGDKRYVLEYSRSGHNKVWVEQGEERRELVTETPPHWGYNGSGPGHFAWALFEDCFGGEGWPLGLQSEVYAKIVYPLVTQAPQLENHVIYEHQMRADLEEIIAEYGRG